MILLVGALIEQPGLLMLSTSCAVGHEYIYRCDPGLQHL